MNMFKLAKTLLLLSLLSCQSEAELDSLTPIDRGEQLRDEIRTWSEKYFARDTAWAFNPYDRQVYFSSDAKTAWFEELLETWMGPCRGSGVLSYTKDGWKLEHYNLAMLIDNEDVEEVLKIIQEQDEQPELLLESQ